MESQPVPWPILLLTAGDSLRINNQEVLIPSAPNNTVAGLVTAINLSGIPNVRAASSRDVVLEGDGATKIFNVGNIYSSASAYTTVVYIDDVLQTQGVKLYLQQHHTTDDFCVCPGIGQ
jgi:hypothetical protein